MPAVGRGTQDSSTTGHSSPCSTSAKLDGAANNVFCNTKPAQRKGHPLEAHTKDVLVRKTRPGTGDNLGTTIVYFELECQPHSASITGGSGTVFVNGEGIARVGDSADGGAISTGSSNVFAG